MGATRTAITLHKILHSCNLQRGIASWTDFPNEFVGRQQRRGVSVRTEGTIAFKDAQKLTDLKRIELFALQREDFILRRTRDYQFCVDEASLKKWMKRRELGGGRKSAGGVWPTLRCHQRSWPGCQSPRSTRPVCRRALGERRDTVGWPHAWADSPLRAPQSQKPAVRDGGLLQ